MTMYFKNSKPWTYFFLALTLFLLGLFQAHTSFASPINENNLQGAFSVEARVANKSYMIFADFLPEQKVQLTLPDDKSGRHCLGSFSLELETINTGEEFKTVKVMKSIVECTNSEGETKKADFDFLFENDNVESLQKGAWIVVRSSLAQGRSLQAKIKARSL